MSLSTASKVPKGAKLITLVELRDDQGHKIIVAATTAGEYFYSMMCGMQGGLNKILLVRDVQSSKRVLESSDAKYTVTGGRLEECVPVPIVIAGVEGFVPEEKLRRRRR